MNENRLRAPVLAVVGGLAMACGGGTAPGGDAGIDSSAPDDGGCTTCADGGELDGGAPDGSVPVPATYTFTSRYDTGASSVGYSGQAARQVLIHDLVAFIETRTEAIDGTPSYEPRDVDGDAVVDSMTETVLFDLDYYYGRSAADRQDDPHGLLDVTPPPVQQDYGDLSTTAILRDKLAGNDTSMTEHRDWSTDFRGISDASLFRGTVDLSSPEGVLDAAFATIAANADDRSQGIARVGPGGEDLPVHITERGLNLAELVEKLLLGALAFDQAADEYLDDQAEDPGVGLLSPNTRDGTNPYTTLEHAWDEGYGYFGIPRHASGIALTDLVGASRAFDGDGDSMTDLTSEYLFSTGRYAAQRDVSSGMRSAPTTFFADAERAFRTGRAIIAATPEGETIPAATLAAIQAQRDVALGAWERAIAASVVRYLNGVIQQTLAIGTAAYALETHVGQWTEAKAFALAFQFHRGSPMLVAEGGEERFVTLHALLGDAPVLADATEPERTAYLEDLRAARALLGAAFGFDAANLGGDDGTGGW